MLLIENVADLVRHRNGETLKEILGKLNQIGYRAEAKILVAADYGVPQVRRRTFILAQRWSDVEATGARLHFPNPTHVNFPYAIAHDGGDDLWLPGDSGYWVTVQEALCDLPGAIADHKTAWPGYPVGARRTAFRRWVRDPSGSPVTHHVWRTLKGASLQRVTALRMGQRASDLPAEIRPNSTYHYSYCRLRWNEPARTVTKFVYNVGSGMFAHPVQDRAITMREAARLQSFPDWFEFPTTRIREASALIGSAVPPLLAWHLGVQVARYLDILTRHELSLGGRDPGIGLATDAVLRRLVGSTWSNDPEAPTATPAGRPTTANGQKNGAQLSLLR